MTIIAYADGVVAADTLVSNGTGIIGTCTKIKLTLSGIAGFAGEVTTGQAWLRYLTERKTLLQPGDKLPFSFNDETSLFCVNESGIFEVQNNTVLFYKPQANMAAWGVASEFTLGMLRAGSSAWNAVRETGLYIGFQTCYQDFEIHTLEVE